MQDEGESRGEMSSGSDGSHRVDNWAASAMTILGRRLEGQRTRLGVALAGVAAAGAFDGVWTTGGSTPDTSRAISPDGGRPQHFQAAADQTDAGAVPLRVVPVDGRLWSIRAVVGNNRRVDPGIDVPRFDVRCQHQLDRSIAVFLVDDGALLGVLPGVRRSYPVVKGWVAEHLGLSLDAFHVNWNIPRPPYVRDGALVTYERDGATVTGRVAFWADSAVMVSAFEPNQSCSGSIPPEDLTFLD